MEIKVLSRDSQAIKKLLDGKRRVMTYGAGSLANDIKKMLREHGYKIDCAIVDDQYSNKNIVTGRGEDTPVVSIEKLAPSYDPQYDVVIWAIGSPQKLHGCMRNNSVQMECVLFWEMGFWKDRDYFSRHKKEFSEAEKLLCDEYSRKVFWSYIEAQRGNIDDDIHYSTNGTYFNELTGEKRKGAFLDCGSYDGASAIDYMEFIGEECRVYAFEPDRENYRNLIKRMKNRPNIVCLNKGCYSAEGRLSFASNGDVSSSLQETGAETVEVTTIDKTVGDEKVAFIKMDIEGAELEALKGAKKIIERDMPVMAISAYHRQEDLITLLPYISRLHSETETYSLYLRHHGVVETELVIYAIPEACGK